MTLLYQTSNKMLRKKSL